MNYARRILCSLNHHDWGEIKEECWERQSRKCKCCPREEFRGSYYLDEDNKDKDYALVWFYFSTRLNGTIKKTRIELK